MSVERMPFGFSTRAQSLEGTLKVARGSQPGFLGLVNFL